MGDIKGEIQKITVRLNLQNSTDARIWNSIEEQIQQKKANNYLKELILLGLQQEEQATLLEEVREIKRLLKENDRKWSLDEIREIRQLFSMEWSLKEKEKTAGLKKTERLEKKTEGEIQEQAGEQTEPAEDETMEKEGLSGFVK